MVASSIDVAQEDSVRARQEVNASSYVSFHNGQIFEDGLSFSGNERNKTWINVGGAFVDLSDLSGADIPNDSRAVVAADFDDDGDVDLFVHSIQRERHALFRNDRIDGGRPGTQAGFLKLRLRATGSQYEAIGALVVVRGPEGPVAQVLARGDGFLSCRPPELVFGLGTSERAEVDVIWPGGIYESFGSLAAGTRALLVEGTGSPVPIVARTRTLPDPLPPGLLLAEGDVVPPLALVDRAGDPTVLDVRALAGGKPVYLNLWASYCAPCVAELPLLETLEQRGEVRVISLSVDVPADRAAAERLLDASGASFPSYFLPEVGAPAQDATPIEALIDLERLTIPTTLVLSPEGRVETILRGPLEGEGE